MYIILKCILNDIWIIVQFVVYKGVIVFFDIFGLEVKFYISIKLFCGGELWYGCQGSRLYIDLQIVCLLFFLLNKV